MECANEMGCDENIVRFVMPLGTTVNMNGTALYEATTVIFLAQVIVLLSTNTPSTQGHTHAQNCPPYTMSGAVMAVLREFTVRQFLIL